MDAEDIVRALAADEFPMDGETGECTLCGNQWAETKGLHEADCPWLLSREWVEVRDGPSPPSGS